MSQDVCGCVLPEGDGLQGSPYGFNLRKLKELPCPLDKEMEAYDKLEGTYRVKSTHYTIEKLSKQSRVDPEVEKEASDLKAVISSHIGLIAAGQDIVVRRPSKEEWLVMHNNEIKSLKMVSRKTIIQSLLRSGGYQVRCYPDAGRLEVFVSFSSDDSLL